MYRTEKWNFSVIICSLVLLFGLYYVPIPVQSYELLSAIIDDENKNTEMYKTGDEEHEYDSIQLEYMDQGQSRITITKANYVPIVKQFPSADYYSRILDYAIIDTGYQDRMVDVRFDNEDEARQYYESIRPARTVEQMTFPVNHVWQYDCVARNCANGRCNDATCAGNVYSVIEDGIIYMERLPSSSKKRFVIRKSDPEHKAAMVFTSKSFNTTSVRINGRMMLSISLRYWFFKIYIEFESSHHANAFYRYVHDKKHVSSSLPLNIPEEWQERLEPDE